MLNLCPGVFKVLFHNAGVVGISQSSTNCHYITLMLGDADHSGSNNLEGKPRAYNLRVGRDRGQTDSCDTREREI